MLSRSNFRKDSICQSQNRLKKNNAIKFEQAKKKFKNESSSEVSILTNSESESDSIEINNELKTPDYTSYDDESLHSDDDLIISKLIIPPSKSKKYVTRNASMESKISDNMQNFDFTGYKLWASQMKKEILRKYPSIDITIMTIRLGEMWTKLSVSDRNNWQFKAQLLTEKSEFFYCEKQEWFISSINQVEEWQLKQSYNELKAQNIQLQPINVAAHLKLLGESLVFIGARVKLINKPVIESDCITVLLDSLLCAIGSLICLAQKLWIFTTDDSVALLKTIGNIAYIIPGL